ncbi:hypothetical protein LI291_14830, partial [Intestinibacillus massiliensis]|nr:hypothetical protein [Intestinibacillus massiliensis]
ICDPTDQMEFIHLVDYFLLEVSSSSDLLFLLWALAPKQRQAEPKHSQITPDEKPELINLVIATM